MSQFIGRIKHSRVPESTNLKDMPPGLVNVAPKKTARTPNPEASLQEIIRYSESIGLPLHYQSAISERVIDIQQFFIEVLNMGGSETVTAKQQWSIVAASLGFPAMNCWTAAHDLRNYWDLHLSEYRRSCET